MIGRPRSSARVAATAALVAGVVGETARRRTMRGTDTWHRRNYRERTATLTAGPAVAAGALAGIVRCPGAAGPLVVGLTGAALGLYDDLVGETHAKGLEGHWQALRTGRLTTGLIKLAGLTTGAAAASVLVRRDLDRAVVDTTLVAGTANLVNLLDLRPGRALKVAVAVALPLAVAGGAGAAAAAAVLGAALVTMPDDLGERVMIGDCGANCLGAVLGWSLSASLPRRGRFAAAAVVVGLTFASERVSFTEVIEGNRWLSAVDGWGRAA